MKTKLFMVLAFFLAGTIMVNAQGGGPRRTPEERTKAAMDKISGFSLDKDKADQADSVFIQYYRIQDAKRSEMMSGGGAPDRDKMRADMQKMAGDRDDKLKKIFSDDQFKKWKDEIEPSLRPQRPQGGNGNSGS